MRIAKIIKSDSANSLTGFTLAIFTQGCEHYCEDCFSKTTWNFNEGEEIDLESLKEMILNSRHKNVSLLGGDPFHPGNRDEVLKLIKFIKEETEKNLYVWTGYTIEEVNEWIPIDLIDYLMTEKFDKDKTELNLKLVGSTNQLIYEKGKLSKINRR